VRLVISASIGNEIEMNTVTLTLSVDCIEALLQERGRK
jgi:hypothetical protein